MVKGNINAGCVVVWGSCVFQRSSSVFSRSLSRRPAGDFVNPLHLGPGAAFGIEWPLKCLLGQGIMLAHVPL